MKKTRFLSLALTGTLCVSLLAGCGTGDTQTTPAPEGSTPVETGTTGATNELNVCFASEPETMDPSMNRTVDGNVMITHLFEGLYKWVDSDPSGDGRNGATAVLEPGMAAEEPTVTPNEDGTYTYTFKLREDAKWSDGQPVTANDFVYSWRRLVDPATASPYNTIIAMVKNANEIIAGELPKEELGVAAPDEHTFEVTLTYNCPYFLDICAFPNCMPLREDIVEGNATWTQDPSTYVTNGAFKMASWTHDAEIVMVPNENYYDASSITLEKLTFKLMDDANAQLTAFKNGDLDYMQNPPPDEMATLLTDGTVIPGDYLGSYYAHRVLGVERPRVGLLNIGTEDSKGTDLQKETLRWLREAHTAGHLNFIGNIEAKEAIKGGCDVIVCDGFSGNVLLKTMEGVGSFAGSALKAMFKKNLLTKLAALCVMPGLNAFKARLDPNKVGGTAFIGISRPVIKAHGSSNAEAIENAMGQAVQVARSGIIRDIEENVALMKVERE